jgi:hypothetical protein
LYETTITDKGTGAFGEMKIDRRNKNIRENLSQCHVA